LQKLREALENRGYFLFSLHKKFFKNFQVPKKHEKFIQKNKKFEKE